MRRQAQRRKGSASEPGRANQLPPPARKTPGVSEGIVTRRAETPPGGSVRPARAE